MVAKMPEPLKRSNSRFYWLRKRVPLRYQAGLGRKEVWTSLETDDLKKARVRCVVESDRLDELWAVQFRPASPAKPVVSISQKQMIALAGLAYKEMMDKHSEDPGYESTWRASLKKREQKPPHSMLVVPERRQTYGPPAAEFLKRQGVQLEGAAFDFFLKAYERAIIVAEQDLLKLAQGDYRPPPHADRFPVLSPEINALKTFDDYAQEAKLKPATLKRWRPIVKQFTEFLGHPDLARVTRADAVNWKKHLLDPHGANLTAKTVRDAYVAAVKATFQFAVDDQKLEENPFAGLRIRGVKDSKDENKKAFSEADARKILTATLQPFSRLISPEMAAARRWIPWLCAYTGARVNEITSLLPSDFQVEDSVHCIVLRAGLTKGGVSRTIPLHHHLIKQGLLAYVEQRRKLDLPLFYHPARSRGGKDAHPHWQKVGQRIAEWVKDLGVDPEIAPNHGWRHRWKSISRDADMHPEVANFIFGHGSGKVSERYGSRWVKTAKKNIERMPRLKIEEATRLEPSGGERTHGSGARRRRTPAPMTIHGVL